MGILLLVGFTVVIVLYIAIDQIPRQFVPHERIEKQTTAQSELNELARDSVRLQMQAGKWLR